MVGRLAVANISENAETFGCFLSCKPDTFQDCSDKISPTRRLHGQFGPFHRFPTTVLPVVIPFPIPATEDAAFKVFAAKIGLIGTIEAKHCGPQFSIWCH